MSAPWAKKAPWAAKPPHAAAPASLADVLSEQLAAKLAEPHASPPAVDADADYALALRLQREEEGGDTVAGQATAAEGYAPVAAAPPAAAAPPSPDAGPGTANAADAGPSTAADAAPAAAAPSTDDGPDADYALALALQEEEDRLAAAHAAAGGGRPAAHHQQHQLHHHYDPAAPHPRHTSVGVVTREQLDERAALAASRAGGGRQLYSEADASALPAPAAEGAARRRLLAPTSAGEARDLAAALREDSEEALYQALKGSGRRAGYLPVGDDVEGGGGGAGGGSGSGGSGGGGGGVASATGVRASIAALGSDGFVTKHDAYLSGRRGARALERSLGPAAGDLREVAVSQAAVGGLQRFAARQSVKGVSAHGRVEAAAHATSEGVLDGRTRAILFRLLTSGRCDAISGSVSTGKEAAVLLACSWHPDVHEQLSRAEALEEGWASQRSRVWDGQEAEEEEGEEAAEAEQDGGEEAGEEGDGEGGAGVGPAPSAAAAQLLGRINVQERRPAPADGGGAPRDKDDDDGGADGASAPWVRPPGGDRAAHHGINRDGSVDVALKVFKLSLNEFRNRKRYMEGDRRFARMDLRRLNPRKIVVEWARKEYQNLVRIHRAGIPSPAPLLLDGHVIAMSFVGADGWPAPQLRHARLTPLGWARAYRQVAAIMRALFAWTHLVHADLSEYNLLWEGPPARRVVVIDVGQAVDASHPLAGEFLAADARTVTSFFARQGVEVLPPEELVALVTDAALVRHPPPHAQRTGSHAGTVPAAGSGARRDPAAGAGAARSVVCDPRPARAPAGGGAAGDAGQAAGAEEEEEEEEEREGGGDGASTTASGPPAVHIEDFDLDELFSGRAGAVARSVDARLAALARGR